MSKHTEKLVVLFADICGSTRLYDTLGDELARSLTASCIATMTAEVFAHQGTLIKTIGDEIMCTFPTVEAGLEAACAMQNAIQNSRNENSNKLHIRIGFHYGEVICDMNDVFGDTVNVAARIAAAARANHILTSKVVVDALPYDLREKTHPIMQAEFKGKQEQYAVFMVEWEDDDDGRTCLRIQQPNVTLENTKKLILRYGERTFIVDNNRKSIIAGRGNDCDIVIPTEFASRQHVSFELRFRKFFIVDQSTNGTYIRLADDSIAHIIREEMVLRGSGFVSLAQSYADSPTDLIEFSVSSTTW